MRVIDRLLALVALAIAGPIALAQTSALPRISPKETAQGYRDGYVLAKPRADHAATVDAAEAAEGLTVHRKFARFGGLRVLKLAPGDTPLAAVRRLTATGRYEFVEPDYLRHTTSVPNDPDFSQQWGLNNTGSNSVGVPIAGADIHAEAAWNTIHSAPNVIVAVLDTGVDNNHPDLKGNLWQNPQANNDGYGDDLYGINESSDADGVGNTTDDDGHGTHVAGIIGAIGNNNTDTSGVAWQVQIMALKLLDLQGEGTSVTDEVTCIDFAMAKGAAIINASFGDDQYTASEYTAIQAAGVQKNIIFVAAAGNNAWNSDLTPFYPADYPLDNIVAVAASDNRDDSIFFSNYGSGIVDLYAPGYNIVSLYNNGSTASFSGTSMSAPFVSGSLALLRAQFPSDTYRQLINRLLGSVDANPNFLGRAQTGGRLDLASAVTSTSNRPFNDQFAKRAHLVGPTITVRSNNAGATLDAGEPVVPGSTGGASLWWDWTAPLTGPVTITTTGSAYAAILAVYTGTSLAALTPVASSTAAGTGASNVSFMAQAGTTYEITVDGQGGASGLTLVNLNNANDDFASAATLTGTSVGITASNAHATLETGEPEILGNAGGHSLWYAWMAPASGRVEISAFSSAFDPLLAIYTGGSLATLSLVSSGMGLPISSSGGLAPGSLCTCAFNATAGTTYMITVDGNSTVVSPTKLPGDATTLLDVGQFTLSIADSRWQYATYDSVTCAPTVGTDGTVYVGSNDGYLYAFSPNGSIKWTFLAFGPFDSSSAALSSDGATIYATSVEYGLQKGFLYAINTADGSLKWRYPFVNAPPACAPTVAADGTIYAKDQTGTLYAFNPDETLKWSISQAGISAATPTMGSDGTIYLGSDNGSLYAINPANGSINWTFTASASIATAAAIDNSGNIYFGTLGGTCYAVSSSGHQIWSFTTGNSITSSPALDAYGNVYFGSSDRYLYAINTANGAVQWKYLLGGEIRTSSPVIDSDGVIYIGCLDGNVYAINSTGTLDRIFATGNGIYQNGYGTGSSPVIAGTTLYFGGGDHKLYAFDIDASAAGSAWPMYLYNSRRVGRAVIDPLAITVESPATVSVTAPAPLALTAASTGEGPLTFQWKLNGVSISGATNSTYVLLGTGPGNGGTYTVVVSGPQGSTTSSAVTVTVIAVQPTFTLAASPATATVATGRTAVFNAIATGTPNPAYQWTLNGSTTIPGASVTNDPILVITGATASDAGTVACTATNSDGSATSSATLAVTTTNDPGYLTNLSGRGVVGSGAVNALFGGFGTSGSGTKNLLIRGMGPSTTMVGIPAGTELASTQLTLYDHLSAVITQNTDWAGNATISTIEAQVGAYPVPANSLDSMLYVSEPVSAYSASVGGLGSATGIAVVELYDADTPPLASRLVNLSVRAPVGTGNNILFGGFSIGGTTDEAIFVRAMGPSLATVFPNSFTPSSVLAQPILTIYLDSDPTPLYTNIVWGGDPALLAAENVVGAYTSFPNSSQDSMLLVSLPAGNYTAEIAGVNFTTGIATVEIYEVY